MLASAWWLTSVALVLSSAPSVEIQTAPTAVVPWSELERLVRERGEALTRAGGRSAPVAHAVPRVDITGELTPASARLTFDIDLHLLEDGWRVIGLFPADAAVSRVRITGGDGFLVRGKEQVSFVASHAGSYQLEVDADLPLASSGDRRLLSWSPGDFTVGEASLRLSGVDLELPPGWTRQRADGDRAETASGPLGPRGLQLSLAAVEPLDVGEPPELEATTDVSLSGAGSTELRIRQRGAPLELTLPAGARVWRATRGRQALTALEGAGPSVRLPQAAGDLRLSYTFRLEPMGLRGRYRVELPRFRRPLKHVSWEVRLPPGVEYQDVQSSLDRGPCAADASGPCQRLTVRLLEGLGYLEGGYRQRL